MDPSSEVRVKRVNLTIRVVKSQHRWLATQKRKTGVPINVQVERMIAREVEAQRQSA